jgi:hypothetical protein
LISSGLGALNRTTRLGLATAAQRPGNCIIIIMAPSTLDLLMLTFNCAKNLINVSIFAHHLQAALSQNATGLPDLVVL